jgi:peptidyl-prolyl cis-trans isomerase SurA
VTRRRPALIGLIALAGAFGTTPTSAGAVVQDAPGAMPDTVELVDRVVAIVGDTAILRSEVIQELMQWEGAGNELPAAGTAGRDSLFRQTLDAMVDRMVLLQKAEEMEDISLDPTMLDGETNARINEARSNFRTATEFTEAVASSGRTMVQYRQELRSGLRAELLIQRFFQQTRESRPPAPVTEEEVETYFAEQVAGTTRPTSVAFEQIAIEPVPTEEARQAALEEAEQALREIRDGEDFEIVARRYSDDPGSRERGGDLGWVRRGMMVPPFENAAWAARTGTPIGPVWTRFGWHIIRVDNIRGGERNLSHILVTPEMGEADIDRARSEAQAIADSARAGTPFDQLAERYGMEELPFRIPLQPLDRIGEVFRPVYAEELADPVPGEIVGPFAVSELLGPLPVFVVIHVTEFAQAGEIELTDEVRQQIRERLEIEKAERRFVEELRNEVYVDVRL